MECIDVVNITHLNQILLHFQPALHGCAPHTRLELCLELISCSPKSLVLVFACFPHVHCVIESIGIAHGIPSAQNSRCSAQLEMSHVCPKDMRQEIEGSDCDFRRDVCVVAYAVELDHGRIIEWHTLAGNMCWGYSAVVSYPWV